MPLKCHICATPLMYIDMHQWGKCASLYPTYELTSINHVTRSAVQSWQWFQHQWGHIWWSQQKWWQHSLITLANLAIGQISQKPKPGIRNENKALQSEFIIKTQTEALNQMRQNTNLLWNAYVCENFEVCNTNTSEVIYKNVLKTEKIRLPHWDFLLHSAFTNEHRWTSE